MLKRPAGQISEQSGPIVGLAAIFVVSLIVGFVFGGIWSRFDQKGIHEDDYIVMVSLIFNRDADLRAAQERLDYLQKNDIGNRVISLADSYPASHPDAQPEARALRQLANAIDQQGTSSRLSAVATADGSEKSFSFWTWLGIALVGVFVLGIGGPVGLKLLRTKRAGGFDARFSRRRGRGSEARCNSRPSRRVPMQSQSRDQESDQWAGDSVPPTRESIPSRTQLSSPAPNSLDTNPQRSVRREQQPTAPLSPKRWGGDKATFVSRYRRGEDLYDEVHPILNPITGELIGACGMSALLKLVDYPDARYYTLPIWAQDYISNEPIRCVGLVSAYCKGHPPAELVRWAQSHMADQIVVPSPGLKLTLDTVNLKVEATVLGLSYGIDVRGPENSYFSELEVSFQVQVLSEALGKKALV